MAQCILDNKKVYVGKTDRTIEERKKEHIQAAVNGDETDFHKTLLEEGLKHWNWRELERCEDDVVLEREQYWIKEMDAVGIDLLNIVHRRSKLKTGNVINKPYKKSTSISVNKLLIEEGLIKPVINLVTLTRYDSLAEAGRKEKDSKDAIRRSCKQGIPTLTGNVFAFIDIDNNPILTENHKKKISRSQGIKRKTFSRRKKVRNIDKDQLFQNVDEAAEKYKVSANQIQAVCSGKANTAKNMVFCYINDEGENILTERHLEYLNKREQKYAVFKIEDREFLNPEIFNSTIDIGEKYGINTSHILSVCRGERQHTKDLVITFWDANSNSPILKKKHLEPIKKQIRKVICLDDDIVFDNAIVAARHYRLNSSQINLVCKGKLTYTGKKRFAYLDRDNNPIKTEGHNKTQLKHKGPIKVYCPELKKQFKSVADFCRETGVHLGRARRHLEKPNINIGPYTLVKID
jgi:hypothetical protein